MQREYFSVPTEVFPLVLTVGLVEADSGANFKLNENVRGNLQLISPEEILHALIFRIAEDINKGVVNDVLQKWRNCVLNASMEFKVCALAFEFC